jgi:protein kinase C substrate 80K-H
MAVKAAVVGYEELTKPFDEESEVKVEESTEVTEEEEEIQDKELDELDRKDLEGLLMMDVDGEVETTEDEGDVGLCKSYIGDIADDSIPDRRIYPRFAV